MSQPYLPGNDLQSPARSTGFVDPARSTANFLPQSGNSLTNVGTVSATGASVMVAQVIAPVRPPMAPVGFPGTPPGGSIPATNIPSAFPRVGNGSAQTYATSFGRGLDALRHGYFSGENLRSIGLEALADTFAFGRIPLDIQNRMADIVRAHGDTIRGTTWWSQAGKDEFNARIGAALALYEEGSLSAEDLVTTAGEALTDINGREEARDIAARRELYRDAPGTDRPATPVQTYGPGNDAGIASAQAAQERARAERQQALDNASRSTPIPGTDVAKTSYAGYTWEQTQQAARNYNNGRADGTIAVPVSYERQYRTESGTQTRREPTIFVGSPVDILNEVARDQQAGRIPAGFDPAGQARQVGVPNWDQMLAADVANRAFATESNNPTTLHGNRVGTFETAGEAIRWAQTNNAMASGADSVALAVPLRVGVSGPGINTSATVETVYLGSPDQLRSFYDTMREQGRIAPGTSFESLLDRSGIAGSYSGRRQAALDLRAMAAEQASPTTLFQSTVGVHPSKGSATSAALAANAGTSGADMVTLYIPLEHEINAAGARGTGVAHTLYRNDPTNMRGFFDEMNRRGRIPDGVTFESLLADSGLSGSFQGRLDAANANRPDRNPPTEPGLPPSRRDEPLRIHPFHPRPDPQPNEGPVPPGTPLEPYPRPNPPPTRPQSLLEPLPDSTVETPGQSTIDLPGQVDQPEEAAADDTPPTPAFPPEVPARPRPLPSDAPVPGDPATGDPAPVGDPAPTDADIDVGEGTTGGSYPFEVTVPEEFRRAAEEAERIYREIAGRPADPLGGGDRDAEIERRIEELRHTNPDVALALEGLYHRNKRSVPGGSPTAATSTGGAGNGTGNNRPTAADFEGATPEEIRQMPIGDLGRWAENLYPDAVYDMDPAKRAAILDRLSQSFIVEDGRILRTPGMNDDDVRAAWAGITHIVKSNRNVSAERGPQTAAAPSTLFDPANPFPAQVDQPSEPAEAVPPGLQPGSIGSATGEGGSSSRIPVIISNDLEQERLNAAYAAWENPVTPAVYNAAFLTDRALAERAADRDIAVLLADSNNFGTYDQIVGNVRGDAGIALTTEALNRISAKFNEIYADQGIFLVGGRFGGDEVYLFAMIDPALSGGATRMPATVPMDMTRLLHEEVAIYNATHGLPIPTGTSSAAIISPDSYVGADGLGEVLHHLDEIGTRTLNQATSSPYFKGGGVVVRDGTTTVFPAPTYPDRGGELPNFRSGQNQVPDPITPYAELRPNVATRTDEGVSARPFVLPGVETGPDLPRVALPPTQLADALGNGDPIESLNQFRNIAPIESVFRGLLAEDIRIYNQPVGLARLDYMLDRSSRDGTNTYLEFYEPRGVGEVNKEGYIVVNGQQINVSHAGGDILINAMMRANHQAIEEVLGAGYDARGDAFVFRDRGKRFANVYGPNVTEEQIRAIQTRRDEIYREMPAVMQTPDGVEHQIYMPDPQGGHELLFNLGYGAVRIRPEAFEGETAERLRDRLVSPLRAGSPSVLSIGKDNADGNIAPLDLIPRETEELEFWISPPRRGPSSR